MAQPAALGRARKISQRKKLVKKLIYFSLFFGISVKPWQMKFFFNFISALWFSSCLCSSIDNLLMQFFLFGSPTKIAQRRWSRYFIVGATCQWQKPNSRVLCWKKLKILTKNSSGEVNWSRKGARERKIATVDNMQNWDKSIADMTNVTFTCFLFIALFSCFCFAWLLFSAPFKRPVLHADKRC